MSDALREFLADLRDHWNDRYWWADHPELAAAVLSVITGVIGVLFAWLETKVRVHALTALREATP